MDIGTFSRCIKELVAEFDRVEVPDLGIFFAELMPASYSDRLTTINPPYRRMYFRKVEVSADGGELVYGRISRTLGVSLDQSEVELKWCISRLRSELDGNKVCSLPGLGLLKATSQYDYFFVPDDNLDIYPDGLGLEPICIKVSARQEQTSPEKCQSIPIDSTPSDDACSLSEGADEKSEGRSEEEEEERVRADAGENDVENAGENDRESAGENGRERTGENDGESARENGGKLTGESQEKSGEGYRREGVWPEHSEDWADDGHNGTAAAGRTEERPLRRKLQKASECISGLKTSFVEWIMRITAHIHAKKKSGRLKSAVALLLDRVVIILAILAGVAVLAAAILFLFREPLSPLIDRLLYTEEELDIIRRFQGL